MNLKKDYICKSKWSTDRLSRKVERSNERLTAGFGKRPHLNLESSSIMRRGRNTFHLWNRRIFCFAFSYLHLAPHSSSVFERAAWIEDLQEGVPQTEYLPTRPPWQSSNILQSCDPLLTTEIDQIIIIFSHYIPFTFQSSHYILFCWWSLTLKSHSPPCWENSIFFLPWRGPLTSSPPAPDQIFFSKLGS